MGVLSDQSLRELLAQVKTIALVGASPKPERPAHYVMAYLQQKGFRVIPVNPGLAGQTLLGETVYAELADIPVPFQMVDIFRRSDAAGAVSDEAVRLGARLVWMQLGVEDDEAAARAEAQGVAVVMNRCPKMELPRLGI